MVSPRKLTANGRNATKSTGPRTAGGKTRSRMNATAHGLRTANPVLPGEDPSLWELFRGGVVADLRAAGTLETELADRIALLLWRLRRVATFEVAAASAPPPSRPVDIRDEAALLDAIQEAPSTIERDLRQFEYLLADALRTEDTLARVFAEQPVTGVEAMFLLRQVDGYLLKDDEEEGATICGVEEEPKRTVVDEQKFLAALGLPEYHFDDPEGWTGWSTAVVCKGFVWLARSADWTLERFLTNARRCAADDVSSATHTVAEWREKLAAAMKRVADAEARHRQSIVIPSGPALETVLRYEPHLSRQLSDAMDLFERVKRKRT